LLFILYGLNLRGFVIRRNQLNMRPSLEGGGPLSPLWLMPLLLACLALLPTTLNQELVTSPHHLSTFADDLSVQNLMVELRKQRGRRALNKRNSEEPSFDSPESEGGVV
ncbi:hypothetical protein PENTCL1PPCAC_11382, partial [Pristionchus entomophagus]